MEEMKNFEKLVDNKLLQLEALLSLFKEFKLMLNSEVLKGGINLRPISLGAEKSNIERRVLEVPIDYPRRGTFTDKIRYMIHDFSRAAELKDFKNMLTEMEGDKADKIWVRFKRAFRQLAHPDTGELIYFHYKNSKHRFYIKHEWLTENKNDVRPEYSPALGIIDDIPIETIVPENIIWHKSK